MTDPIKQATTEQLASLNRELCELYAHGDKDAAMAGWAITDELLASRERIKKLEEENAGIKYRNILAAAKDQATIAKQEAELARHRAAFKRPIATLHNDGYWTHAPGYDPLDQFSGKVRLDVFAAPQPLNSADAQEGE
jgi:D-tyrosyl-tRNA(Tyr) deacylase